jgi:hypothetical protein
MSGETCLTVCVPLAIRRRPGRKMVVTPDGVATPAQATATTQTRGDPALVKALARAFRYQRMLDQGRYASISEMAAAERLERGYLGSLLRLTLLAPDIVSLILDGRQPEGLTLAGLAGGVPAGWDAQRNTIGANTPGFAPTGRIEGARTGLANQQPL